MRYYKTHTVQTSARYSLVLPDPGRTEIGDPCNMPLTIGDEVRGYCGVIVRTIWGFWFPAKHRPHWFDLEGRPVYHPGPHRIEWQDQR